MSLYLAFTHALLPGNQASGSYKDEFTWVQLYPKGAMPSKISYIFGQGLNVVKFPREKEPWDEKEPSREERHHERHPVQVRSILLQPSSCQCPSQ